MTFQSASPRGCGASAPAGPGPDPAGTGAVIWPPLSASCQQVCALAGGSERAGGARRESGSAPVVMCLPCLALPAGQGSATSGMSLRLASLRFSGLVNEMTSSEAFVDLWFY